MPKPAQRAASRLPEEKRVPWHWKALLGLMALGIVSGGLVTLSRDTQPAPVALVAPVEPAPTVSAEDVAEGLAAIEAIINPPAPHYLSGEELDQYVVKVALGGGHGSGVVIGDGTYILTAAHVAIHAPDGQLVIVQKDGTALDAHVLWIGANSDLALLKLDDATLPAAPLQCTAPPVGSSLEIVGHPAVGDTLNWMHTFGRVGAYYSGYGNMVARIMFFDGSVYPGNSGGPIFNDKGEVVGIVVALLGASMDMFGTLVPFGYNIAVPSDVACGMMPL